MDGFVLNHQLHWYTVRYVLLSKHLSSDLNKVISNFSRFGSPERFYNLNSQLEKPEWISATYLGLFLREAENQGQFFAV